MSYIQRNTCRLCQSNQLELVLSLTPTPPANEFVSKNAMHIQQVLYPLDVYQCLYCHHVQLLDVVDRSLLFKNYVYVSGTSPVLVSHFQQYTLDITQMVSLTSEDLVIDIGSNDGTLLAFFKDEGCRILGIDPAESIADTATQSGIETLPVFFNAKEAETLLHARGPAKVIMANNVFAHIDDLVDFTCGIKTLMTLDSLFVFEVSYLVNVYERTLFDTIYHEHLSYHSIISLQPFLKRLGLELFHVQRVPTHGGSIRCFVQLTNGPYQQNPSIQNCIDKEIELGLNSTRAMSQFNRQINSIKTELCSLLTDIQAKKQSIAGFGAPAKATTLLYHFEIDPSVINYIVDDNTLKQGLYSPGMHIPVVSSSVLKDKASCPDYLIILAWNFAEPIMLNHHYFSDTGGLFIIPLPTIQVKT